MVIRTGTANIASVLAGLRRAGAAPRVSSDPLDVQAARMAVLPGVGTVSAAMERIDGAGLADPLRRRLSAGRPTLCVCLGLQLLAGGSEESPGVEALGVVPGTATRFSGGVRVPQLGWNRVEAGEGCRLLRDGHAYFANSYKLDAAPEGWCAATSDHGGRFVAAMERGSVLACQFHPELSGAWGLDLIGRWLEAGGEAPC
ncbi:MAG: imidazole glycerol phosphate synthase subunit HisH [Deltaproteobacteria bacterium]|nr:imidazole glycerol phosphate synthase subunit HisH [Deltaproteobacteria bacterium]